MILTKSKYCRSIQCPKMLWMDVHKKEEAEPIGNEAVLETGIEVGILARDYFGEHVLVDFDVDKQKMVEVTRQYMADGNTLIAEASFLYGNHFCSVDILRVTSDGVDIIEVKSSTEVHDIYIDDMAYQYYVVSHSGLQVNRVYNMHINNQYVRYGELDLQQLFVLEDCTEQILLKQSEVEPAIERILSCVAEKEEPSTDIGLYCVKPYECEYKDYCSRHVGSPSVFEIQGLRNTKKYDLYYQGIISFEDIIREKPSLSDKQMQQVVSTYYEKPPEVDKQEIKAFLDTLPYPLYFLDFETYQQAIPRYDGVSPYMQIPFQYSLHVLRGEDETLQHYEFLGKEGTDPRRELAEQLCAQIPENVCVLAYNMSFERGVLKRLAGVYEDLSEHLMNIHDNIKDLMIPFQKHYYYCKEMQGSYSIKWVLPALCPGDPELDYHVLEDIHNGSEAMTAFADLPNHSEEEIQKIRKNLLAYCRLDTLAMVKIWEKLQAIVQE